MPALRFSAKSFVDPFSRTFDEFPAGEIQSRREEEKLPVRQRGGRGRNNVDTLYDLGLEATRWLQRTYPQLASLLAVVSDLGRFEFYLAIIPLIYWSIHKRFGKQVAYLLAVTNVANAILKHALRMPRPYWLQPEVGISAETSYGFPSGHTQVATPFYLYLALKVRQRWMWLLALFMIFLMGLSRVYLGVHFVHGAIGGALLGLLLLGGQLIWLRYLAEPFRNRILGQRLLVAITVPVAAALLYGAIFFLIGEASDEVAWSAFVETAERTSLQETTSAVGILLGLGIGFILEASRVHFIVDGSLVRRGLRYALGIVVTLAIWRGLGDVFPDDPLWLALPLRLFRYWLAGMWVAYYAPLVFVRTRLADASPEPEVQLTISNGGIMKR